MSDVDWRSMIEAMGERPFAPNNNESRIAEAARLARVGVRKIRRLFYEETDDPRFKVGVAIQSAAHEQADRFDAIAASLEAKNHELYLADVTRLRALAQRIRGKAR